MSMFVLFEHASGYAIFKVIAKEEIGALLPEVQESVLDLERFGKVVKLVAFSPFKSAVNALENLNNVSEGVAHDDLKAFLENNIPTGKKKSKVVLGVADGKLGGSIQEKVDIQCETGDAVPELLRGVRLHFHKMVEGLTAVGSGKAQLGLGHSYSRAKVKFNVHRVDNMIIQTIAILDQLDKDINTFSMRIREWYGYHFPELVKIVNDNYMYARVVKCIGSRKSLDEEKLSELEEIVMDESKVKTIHDASKISMGMDIAPLDLINIGSFATKVIDLADYRKKLHAYLCTKMEQVAPNLSEVIGELVGARLIAHAGSLTNLAKYPASTVQILGAEKALFRALKTRGKTPKYGLIFHSSFIGRAGAKNKGRISRYLANKCSIASRIDCFSDNPSSVFGKKLHEQVEDRLEFYNAGKTPKKNLDVMKEAIEELSRSVVEEDNQEGKKKKKKKDRKSMQVEVEDEEKPKLEASDSVSSSQKKKKKKKNNAEDEKEPEEKPAEVENEEPEKKKKKKKKRTEDEEGDEAKTEKKRKLNGADVSLNATDSLDTTADAEAPKKKKKKDKKKNDD
ncbi:nucleolar protein 56-like [Rhopilema esculentum]|uniref:nucleolar protein 56-like n=1 Tax=Rhopilema esculentum TaxID=499914 RepID=UPI0031D96DF1